MKRFFKNKIMLPVLMLSLAFIVSPSDNGGSGEGSEIPYSPADYSMSKPASPNLDDDDDLVPSTPGSSLIAPASPDFDASPFSGDPFDDDFYAEAAGALRSPGCFVNTGLGSRKHSLEVDSPHSPAAASAAIVADASAAEAASAAAAQASAQSLTDSHVAVVVADTADRPKNKKAAKSGKASASSANAGSGGGGGGGSETVEVDGEKNVDAKVLAEVKRVISEESQAGDLTPVELANKILRRVIQRDKVPAKAGYLLFEKYAQQCDPLTLSFVGVTLLESSVLKADRYFDSTHLLVQKIVSMEVEHKKRALELLNNLKIKQLASYKKDLSGGVFRCLAKIYQAIQDLDPTRYPNTDFIIQSLYKRDSIMKDAVLRAIKNDLGASSDAKAASASSFSAESSSLSAAAILGSGGGGGGGSGAAKPKAAKSKKTSASSANAPFTDANDLERNLFQAIYQNGGMVIKKGLSKIGTLNFVFTTRNECTPLKVAVVSRRMGVIKIFLASRYELHQSDEIELLDFVNGAIQELKKRAFKRALTKSEKAQLSSYISVERLLVNDTGGLSSTSRFKYVNTPIIYRIDRTVDCTADLVSASSASAGSGGGGGGGGGSGAAPVAKSRAAKRKLSGDRPVNKKR